MAGKIIWWIIMFGCALLFYGIGVYAMKSERPMHFYSGTEIDPSSIRDIKQYNKENGKMWKCYSLWYVASAIAEIWYPWIAFAILMLSCSIGLLILLFKYHKILNKYSVH